ncbi:MAG: hypothetical protein K2P57_13150 [Burkholderiales bacterium]|nr:hypothetical protein [Burkholderiales bacterium]
MIARAIFRELIWNVQDYEWNENEHIVSIVNFDLDADGMLNKGLSARILQPVDETAPLEISYPTNYDGLLDFAAFREAAASYYRVACKEGMTGRNRLWSRSVEYGL